MVPKFGINLGIGILTFLMVLLYCIEFALFGIEMHYMDANEFYKMHIIIQILIILYTSGLVILALFNKKLFKFLIFLVVSIFILRILNAPQKLDFFLKKEKLNSLYNKCLINCSDKIQNTTNPLHCGCTSTTMLSNYNGLIFFTYHYSKSGGDYSSMRERWICRVDKKNYNGFKKRFKKRNIVKVDENWYVVWGYNLQFLMNQAI
jgi:hypothetical protein